jgi:hypothetical protein
MGASPGAQRLLLFSWRAGSKVVSQALLRWLFPPRFLAWNAATANLRVRPCLPLRSVLRCLVEVPALLYLQALC